MSRVAQSNHYTFYRYLMIFFFSGSRSSELLRIKKKDVNLELREFKITILKGNRPFEIRKPILGQALEFWTEIVQKARNEDYLFTKDLEPSDIQINPNQITKRWYRLVKKRFDIEEDFYSLKHLFMMSCDRQHLKTLTGHTNNETENIYLVNSESLKLEQAKKIVISFE